MTVNRLFFLIPLAALAVLPAVGPATAAGLLQGRLMNHLDANGDGGIDRGEFEAAMARRFVRLDANRDGVLDKAEIDAAREHMARRVDAAMTIAEERMDKRDADGDGTLSKAEFVRVPAFFDMADKDRNGRLDKDELAAARAAIAGR